MVRGLLKPGYEEEHGCELSKSMFKKLSREASGRSKMTLQQNQDSAFHRLTRKYYGKFTRKNQLKMRSDLAEGLNKEAVDKYKVFITNLAKGGSSDELLALAKVTDYMVMLSDAAAFRYTCRQVAAA